MKQISALRFSVAALAALCLVSFSGSVWALSADEILVKTEDAMSAPKDRAAKVKLTLKDKSGATKVREMKILQKGKDKRLFTFLAPADVKGVSFLVMSDDETYLYTPAFDKIRRIASSAKNEDFMGTDFSYNDLSRNNYPSKYNAKLVKEEGSSYFLECTPKANGGAEYGKVEMEVDKASFMPVKVVMYDKSLKLLKILTSGKIEKIDGYWTTKIMTMVDKQKDHSTVMEMIELRHDTGVSDDEFTKRNLKKFH